MQDYLLGDHEYSLYDEYVRSRRFIASLDGMREFVQAALKHDFSKEPEPVRSAGLVVYTCSRLGDPSAIQAMLEVVRRFEPAAGSSDRFYYDYISVAADEADSAVLLPYIRAEGRSGAMAAVRSASLAFFLRDESLLHLCVERLSERYPRSIEFQEWEYELASTMYSIVKMHTDVNNLALLKQQAIAVGRLQRMALGEPDMLRYFQVDREVLSRLSPRKVLSETS